MNDPNEYRALVRLDFNAFIERSFYELNPTTPFQSELAYRSHSGRTRGLSSW